METLNEINKALKLGNLNDVNTCLKRYGLILKDINIEKTNKRYTTIKYRSYYFKIVMQHGETIEITKSKYELQLY
jgi:hypothetical protein